MRFCPSYFPRVFSDLGDIWCMKCLRHAAVRGLSFCKNWPRIDIFLTGVNEMTCTVKPNDIMNVKGASCSLYTASQSTG
jgi:hypothetical protein